MHTGIVHEGALHPFRVGDSAPVPHGQVKDVNRHPSAFAGHSGGRSGRELQALKCEPPEGCHQRTTHRFGDSRGGEADSCSRAERPGSRPRSSCGQPTAETPHEAKPGADEVDGVEERALDPRFFHGNYRALEVVVSGNAEPGVSVTNDVASLLVEDWFGVGGDRGWAQFEALRTVVESAARREFYRWFVTAERGISAVHTPIHTGPRLGCQGSSWLGGVIVEEGTSPNAGDRTAHSRAGNRGNGGPNSSLRPCRAGPDCNTTCSPGCEQERPCPLSAPATVPDRVGPGKERPSAGRGHPRLDTVSGLGCGRASG